MVFAWNKPQEVTSSANEKSPENSVHVCFARFSHSYAHLIMFTHWKFKSILKQSLLQPYSFRGHILPNFSFLHRIICHVLSQFNLICWFIIWGCLLFRFGYFDLLLLMQWYTRGPVRTPLINVVIPVTQTVIPMHTSTCAEGSIWMETIM